MKKVFVLRVVIILLLFSFITANATVWYVHPDSLLNSIQAGIDSSSTGDTVLAAEGTYFENINFNGKNIVVGSMFLTTYDTTYISSTIIPLETEKQNFSSKGNCRSSSFFKKICREVPFASIRQNGDNYLAAVFRSGRQMQCCPG